MSKKRSLGDPFAVREAEKYDRPIPSREFIAEHLRERGKPAKFQDLVHELDLVDDEERQEALHRRIKAMLRDEQLERLRGGFFWPAGNRILVEGRVLIEKGKIAKTWVVPNDGSARIRLTRDDAYAVYNGNRVIVSTFEIDDNKSREGKVVEIIEQQRIVVTGRFVQEAGYSYVIPHGKEVVRDIFIPPGNEGAAQDATIVVVELIHQAEPQSDPVGKVIEVLGSENAPGIEVEAASHAYGLPHVFPEAVLEEIKKFTETVPPAAKRDRLDLRELPLVTIDGEDAKDFDDAVYCEVKREGGFRLYVAIADVSYYVRPDTALDKEAIERGNSVYFPGKVIPMLPEVLSNGLCSLNPDVDRLCMVCVMSISTQGQITRYDFQEGLIRSHARLTYTKVSALLTGENENLKTQYAHVLSHLQSLYKLYHVLRKEREVRGAIEFETVETRAIFGKNGKINRIEPVHRNDAHRLIEECMLCANVACARFLKKHKMPALYRNHEGPPEEKLADLRTFLAELGLPLPGGKTPTPLDYAKLLKSVQNRPDVNIIQSVLLRSLSQAVYSKDNLGHFGLAYPAYCHFTSPIRRYPDLLVHRQIREILKGEWTPEKAEAAKSKEYQDSLAKLGDHTSLTERRADDATRDVMRWLKCEYIQKHLGESFEGIISGVTHFGFFVELKELYIDGLVHVTSLKNDYYYFDQIHHCLMGERSGVSFKLGDTVQVKVSNVNIDDRKIDFELLQAASQPGQKKAKRTSSVKGREQKEKSANKKRWSHKNRHKKKKT